MDRELIEFMREFTQKAIKSNYEIEKKDIKPLVVFAASACDEVSKAEDTAKSAEEKCLAMKEYITKVVKFLSASDTLQPAAKDFATFLVAKAKSFR